MSMVTTAEFKKYSKKMEEDVAGEALYQAYIDAAESILQAFLSYNPAAATYTGQLYYGDGKPYLQLKAKPITALTAVSVDGVSRTVGDFSVDQEMIIEKTGVVFPVGSTVLVTYTAGYSPIPGIVKIVILEIATLLSMEAGENIGVSSTSFDGGNTRSFINYTDFKKYLRKVEHLRISRLPRTAP